MTRVDVSNVRQFPSSFGGVDDYMWALVGDASTALGDGSDASYVDTSQSWEQFTDDPNGVTGRVYGPATLADFAPRGVDIASVVFHYRVEVLLWEPASTPGFVFFAGGASIPTIPLSMGMNEGTFAVEATSGDTVGGAMDLMNAIGHFGGTVNLNMTNSGPFAGAATNGHTHSRFHEFWMDALAAGEQPPDPDPEPSISGLVGPTRTVFYPPGP